MGSEDTIVIVNKFNFTQISIRFDILAYVLFIGTLYLAYLLFRLILGRMFHYERHDKSPAKHYHHLVDTFVYGTVLFIFGNYSQSFNWITALCIIVGLFGFASICELPFCKCSLETVRTWDVKLKAICVVAIVIIIGCAGYHFYLAANFEIDKNGHKLILIYVLSLVLICLFLFASTIVVYRYQNMKYPNLKRRIVHVGERERHIVMTRDEFEQHQNDGIREAINKDDVLFMDMPRCGYHLHHWQIFYYLAFFTRFDDPISQICAGLVIGIFMHGVSAYGFHDLLEE